MRRIISTLVVALAVALATSGPSGGQTGEVRIRDAALDDDGATRLTVSVQGLEEGVALDAASFTVEEDGRPIESVSVTPLLETRVVPLHVVLVIDHSGSTRGAPLDAALTGARSVLADLTGRGVSVGLVTFGDGVSTALEPGTDPGVIAAALDGVVAAGETALYDALTEAATMLERREGQRHAIVFSDGGDTVSAAGLDDAVASVAGVGVAVHTVMLDTPEVDEQALDRLVVSTNGTQRTVGAAADVSAAFATVVRTLTSQYVLEYVADPVEAAQIAITVTHRRPGGEAWQDQIIASNPRTLAAEVPTLRNARPAASAPVPALANDTGLRVAVGGASVAVLLLAFLLLDRRTATPAERLLRDDLARRRARSSVIRPAFSMGDVLRRLASAAERLPGFSQSEEALQRRLDRAGWPMRASEFVVLRAAAGVAGGLGGVALLRHPGAVLVVGPLAAVVPDLVLARRVRAQRSRLDESLPDVLQLLAGSLRAGYGLLQAIDLAAKEGASPLREEFSRVLTEVRLGVPVADALEAMAERLDHRDLRWVVMAVNIQLEVGGNLADLLATVSETIRSRQQLRRHVAALSADGRLSAVVLSLLPIVAAGLLLIVDRGYIQPLFTTGAGLALLGASIVFLALGIAWIRGIIRIEM